MSDKLGEVEAHKRIAEEAWHRGLHMRDTEVAELRAENERLRVALAKGRALVNDMDELMPSEATEDAEGWIYSYRIPVGPWHRILGWARGGW